MKDMYNEPEIEIISLYSCDVLTNGSQEPEEHQFDGDDA